MNPAVSTELLTEILSWKNEGATETNIVYMPSLTANCVSRILLSYCVLVSQTWLNVKGCYSIIEIIGKTEDKLCMLRSILAQLHYKYEVLEWEKKGVPFRSHIYVPEVQSVLFMSDKMNSYFEGIFTVHE